MPKSITEYKIFIASPTDVTEEREILENVINEINLTVAQQHGIKLQLVKWETHSYPSFGIDAQDVISSQIDEYDIFIGIMNSRFGSPTSKSSSGTYEEFQNAYLKWRKTPDQITVMFYFKQGLIDITKIDPEQLQKVIEFQKEIKDKGGLYRTFENSQQFAELLRLHLSNLIPNLNTYNQALEIQLKTQTIQVQSTMNKDLSEVGMYESIEIGVQKFGEAFESMSQMTSHTNDLTTKINLRTRKLKTLSGASNEVKQREMRRIVDLLAGDYFDFCSRINAELPIYRIKFEEAIEYVFNAQKIYYEWQNKEDNELTKAYSQLINSIDYAKNETYGFKESVKGIPGLTTKMIKAKKEVFITLDKLDSEFNFSIQLISEVSL